jgi:hypothetical protein
MGVVTCFLESIQRTQNKFKDVDFELSKTCNCQPRKTKKHNQSPAI